MKKKVVIETNLSDFNDDWGGIYHDGDAQPFPSEVTLRDGEEWGHKHSDIEAVIKRKVNATNTQIGYFECDTAAATAGKTVNAPGYVLTNGSAIKIKMVNRNSAADATLNINSTGVMPLYYAGERASATNSWEEGETVEVYYDGTSYYANNVAGGSGSGDGAFDISAKTGDTYETLSAALTAANDILSASKKKGGMSIKFIQLTPATYNVVKTEGVTTQPTGTELLSASSIGSGTYTADQLSDFTTLPTSSAVTYYVAVTEDETTTYTTWVITKATSDVTKYVQYRLMATAWSTTAANWQGVDDEPTAGSQNLAGSGGTYKQMLEVVTYKKHDVSNKAGTWTNYASGTAAPYATFELDESGHNGVWHLTHTSTAASTVKMHIGNLTNGKTYRLSFDCVVSTGVNIAYIRMSNANGSSGSNITDIFTGKIVAIKTGHIELNFVKTAEYVYISVPYNWTTYSFPIDVTVSNFSLFELENVKESLDNIYHSIDDINESIDGLEREIASTAEELEDDIAVLDGKIATYVPISLEGRSKTRFGISSGVWTTLSTSRRFYVLDVKGNRGYAMSTVKSVNYCFLKSYPVIGESVDYATGYTGTVSIDAGGQVKVTSPSDANYLYVTAVTSDGGWVDTGIEVNEIVSVSEVNKDTSPAVTYNDITIPFSGKLSIIGDSNSAYDGYVINGYSSRFPAEMVTWVGYMWWSYMLDISKCTLEVNASYSGSTVVPTSSVPGFYERTLLIGNPDVVFVMLGTNDSKELGSYDWDTPTADLSQSKFIPAYTKGVRSLLENYPNAKIYLMIGYFRNANGYDTAIKTIGAHYNLPVIDVRGFETVDNIHATRKGMVEIARSIVRGFSTADLDASVDRIDSEIEDINSYFTESTNLFDSKTCTKNATLKSDGSISSTASNYFVTDFIPVDSTICNKILVTGAFTLCLYDSNKELIQDGYITGTAVRPPIDITGVSYIVVCYSFSSTFESGVKNKYIGYSNQSDVRRTHTQLDSTILSYNDSQFIDNNKIINYASDKSSCEYTESFSFYIYKGDLGYKNMIVGATAMYVQSEGVTAVPTIKFVYTMNSSDVYESPEYIIGNPYYYEEKQWRCPPFPKFCYCRVYVTIPEGVTLYIKDIYNTYSNEINRNVSGYKLNGHFGHSNIMAWMTGAKVGYPAFVTVPKRTSDGVWVGFHDEIIGTQLKDANGNTPAQNHPEIENVGISDLTFEELQTYTFAANYLNERERKVPTLDDFFRICSRTGMNPMFSVHPVPTESEYEELKALAIKYNVLSQLELKPLAADSHSVIESVFGNSIKGIYVQAGDRLKNNGAQSVINLLDSYNVDRSKVSVGITINLESFSTCTAATVAPIIAAGYHIVLYKHIFSGVEFKYWMDNGVHEFTEDANYSYGLNW